LELLNQLIDLPNVLNIRYSSQLSEDLKGIKMDTKSRPASFDITNMYSNIPTTEEKSITENTLKTKHTDEKQKYLMGIYDIIITQNYFTYNNTFFQQTNDLATGSPSSETLLKLFLRYI
jgi:hypothetical protein